jgi:quercetin dioxygenase-like cupin family protein
MTHRHEQLQEFLESLNGAISVSDGGRDVSSVAKRLFAMLAHPAPPAAEKAARLPACRHLPAALQSAQSGSPQLARLATALAAIEPSLEWKARTTSGPFASDNWPDGHANAMIIGPGGVEDRDDIMIGVSLLAPHVRYPDHHHAPEEIYLAMTRGRFQHGESDWCEPGPGGAFHNEPNIKHAMASDEGPLLAIWCLLPKADGFPL